MNLQHALSRRSFMRRGAITSIAVLGTSAAAIPLASSVLAQNGDIELVCISDGVRIRDAAGLGGNILGSVNTGDAVNQIGGPVDADGYTWIQVSVIGNRNLSGWAASEFFERAGGTTGWAPGTKVHVNSDGVNFRSGPGTGNSVIRTYNNGDNALIVSGPASANGYDWYQITVSNDEQGWMASSFLSPGWTNSAGDWPAGMEVHVNTDGVNLRREPGLGGGIIATLNANTNAGVIGGPQAADGYEWYKIGIGGGASISGWMASDFLSEGAVGIPGEPTGFPEGSWVWTTTDLNLRSDPGTGNGVVATYGMHEAATIITGPQPANGYGWYQVEMADDRNVGWMAGEFLEYAPTEPTGSRRRVSDGPLNLRSNPTINASIVTSLPTGTIVVVSDASFVQEGAHLWASVYLESNPDVSGWVDQHFTEEI
jgi:uncharacterized protein YgiM (DUF1202 family)